MRDIWTKLKMPAGESDTVTRQTGDDLPQPMREAEIMYADISASRLSVLAKMIGGVISPASIASACWRPLVNARRMGSSESRA